MHRVLIAGAGIGGLAAALACRQRGCEVTVLEAAAELSEVGAGIQLGPNAMKVLAALGLESELLRVASVPEAIVIAQATTGRPISRMLLGEAIRQRDGQVYVCIHRADLQRILYKAARASGVQVITDQLLQKYEQSAQEIKGLSQDSAYISDVLIGADGLRSRVREQLVGDGAPLATGHAAFRAVLPRSLVPASLRTPQVRLWWGRDVHVVSYPVRSGEMWNVVVLSETGTSQQPGWALDAEHHEVVKLMACAEPQLLALLHAVGESELGWKRWNLFDRRPLDSSQMAQARAALLGDAAHPMLPYLAQGAAMALEDAWALGQQLQIHQDAVAALRSYAVVRAARNARVAQTAKRNAWIFHLSGPLAMLRNAWLLAQGTSVVSMSWLYGFNSCASEPSVVLD